MSKPKLFVSHSSKTKKNLAFLKSVCETLGKDDAGFHVLVDQSGEIPTGEEWFRYLSEWMAECDAAVILFSRAAAEESQWVRAESAILTWRKRIQPSFKLIGVLLDDLEPKDLEKDEFFNVIRITDFQFVRDRRNEQEILDQIKTAFADLKIEESPFDHLITLMREILSTVPEEALERAWDELEGRTKPHWEPGKDFADSLARLLFRDPIKSLSNFRLLIQTLATLLTRDKGLKMLELVKGLWVNGEAAGNLAWIGANGRAAMLNGEEVHEFTGDSYIRRLWSYPHDYKLVSAAACRKLEDVKKVLLEPFDRSGSRHAARRLEKYQDPLFLVFPYSDDCDSDPLDRYPDVGLVNGILDAHRNVTVVVATGSGLPEELDYLAPVMPELEPGQEFDQFDRHWNIIDYIDSQLKG